MKSVSKSKPAAVATALVAFDAKNSCLAAGRTVAMVVTAVKSYSKRRLA